MTRTAFLLGAGPRYIDGTWCVALLVFLFVTGCGRVGFQGFQNGQVATPVMSPLSGTYSSDQNVTITCATTGAEIRYTTDGSDPIGTYAVYSSPISVAGHGTSMTIKAIAIKDGMLDSTISTESYLIREDYTIDWSDSVDITIDAHTLGLGGDVAQFPLLIRLNTSNFPDIATKTKSGGVDIRFAKTDETHLYYEIEDWVDNTSGVVWVLIDNISSSSQITIKMYYNNPGATSESNPNAVFDTVNHFVGVWHLDESSGNFADATSNGYAGTDNVSATGKDGVIGPGQKFDGANDYIGLVASSIFLPTSTQNFSISTWFNADSISAEAVDNRFMTLHYQDTGASVIGFGLGEDNKIMFYNEDSCIEHSFPTIIGIGTWYYATLTWDGTNYRRYYNGDIDGPPITEGLVPGGSAVAKIGIRNTDPMCPFDGYLDEVRFSTIARSTDWIKLSYETQKSDQTVVTFP